MLGAVCPLAYDMPTSLSVFKICVCPSRSPLGQLNDGVRYFDLRMSWRDETNDVWTCHSFFCSPLAEILDDVRRFSMLHPREVVILKCSHWCDTLMSVSMCTACCYYLCQNCRPSYPI